MSKIFFGATQITCMLHATFNFGMCFKVKTNYTRVLEFGNVTALLLDCIVKS